MQKKDRTRIERISPVFNYVARGRELCDYTITLARPSSDLAAQAEGFAATLSRWLHMQADDFKGNAEEPQPASSTTNARVSVRCTEETMARIERQFAGDILRTDPPAQHVRGAVYPPKVDPWDISKW